MEAILDGIPPAISRDLLGRIEAVRDAARIADWPECQRLAIQSLGQGYALLRQLQARRIVLSTLAERMANRHEQIANALKRVARSNRAEAFFSAIHANLANQEQDEFTDSILSLAKGETRRIPLLEALNDVARSTISDIYDLESDFAVAGLTQGLMAQVHVIFNQRLKSVVSPGLPGVEQTNQFRTNLDAYEDELRSRQLAIYTQLVNKSTGWRIRVNETAFATAGWVESALLGLVAQQADAHKVMRHRIEAGQGAAAESVGKQLARAGLLTRQSIATQAASYRLALECIRTTPRKEAEKAVSDAVELAFKEDIPHGRDTELSKLEETESGQFVEIWGVVKESTVLKLGGDLLVTRVRLQATRNDAAATAVVRFAHLPHAGLTPGAFVRLSGAYQRKSALNGDSPAVEIQQLPLAKFAESSWLMAFYRLAGPWIRPWRTGANMMWSLGEHTGVEEPDDLMGAGELWFTRPVKL